MGRYAGVRTMKRIRFACVPEQVNIPVFRLAEKGLADDLKLEVQIVPEGTGKMIEMLEKNETDVALTVTDALIAANHNRRKVQISGVFVSSPLIWAVSAKAGLQAQELGQFLTSKSSAGLRIGISRLGSGSHTMGSYMASQFKANKKGGVAFSVANTFQGLREGVNTDKFDAFLWETYTTKPYFDKGEISKMGEVTAPWPAFCFATSPLSPHPTSEFSSLLLHTLYPALYKECLAFKSQPTAGAEEIVQRFSHSLSDAQRWLEGVQYAEDEHMSVDEVSIARAIRTLHALGVLEGEGGGEDLYSSFARLFLKQM